MSKAQATRLLDDLDAIWPLPRVRSRRAVMMWLANLLDYSLITVSEFDALARYDALRRMGLTRTR